MNKLLIATKNPGKFAEFQILLKDLPFKLVSLKDLKIDHEVEEDGKTFAENASKKAREYCQLSGLPTIADDGGLEIDALGGQPGVHSRRWFGYRMTDREVIRSILTKMKGVPPQKRTAKLSVAIACTFPKGKTETVRAEIPVIIAQKPYSKITPGYPQRSLMIIPKLNKYFVELPFVEQSKYSSRTLAVKKLKKYLKNIRDFSP